MTETPYIESLSRFCDIYAAHRHLDRHLRKQFEMAKITDLTPADYVLLAAIDQACGPGGWSSSRVSELTGLNLKTVSYNVRKLQEIGVLSSRGAITDRTLASMTQIRNILDGAKSAMQQAPKPEFETMARFYAEAAE